MVGLQRLSIYITTAASLLCPRIIAAQEMPSDYKAVLTALGKSGDFKDNVLKVNIPRKDVTVTIGKRPAPTPFGFGGWIAMTKSADGGEVLMGDLVLTEDEVNPVMSALLDSGLDVTALHNHFFWEQPRIFYMHVHGMGSAADLTRRVKPALDLIDRAAKGTAPPAPSSASSAPATLDGAALAAIIGHQGEQSGPVYKITIGRPDLDVREHGAAINARMGLNTWAAFTGTDADAMVAGDVAMLEREVTPVLKALRSNGLNVVAIHHHMTDVTPMVVFLHYYGTGPAAKLAQGVRAAVDLLGKAAGKVLFICPHGAAKSVLASAYFQRIAKERGLNVQVDFAGTEPDSAVAPKVVQRLKARGYPPPTNQPRRVTAEDLASADLVISLGCDLTGLPPAAGAFRRWDDVPPPSEDFDKADEAILRRVGELVEELIRDTKQETR
jgi:protein-tyrosine-phosphatase